MAGLTSPPSGRMHTDWFCLFLWESRDWIDYLFDHIKSQVIDGNWQQSPGLWAWGQELVTVVISARWPTSQWGHVDKWMCPFQRSQIMFGFSTVSAERQRKNLHLMSPSVVWWKYFPADVFAIRSYTDPTYAVIVPQYDGPLSVLHTMMVDPNGIIKKPRGKDLPVTRGEIVDVIHFTNSKKALCSNQFGKCT